MKKQSGFALVESLLVILILAVVGVGGYTVWHNEESKKVDSYAACVSNSGTIQQGYPEKCTKEGKSFINPSQKAPAVPTTKSPASAQKYLTIKELGVKLPLSDNLSGLYYWWDGEQAWILSPVVDQYAAKQDPSSCSAHPASLSSTNTAGGQNYQEIGLIYEGSGGPEGKLSTVTVEGRLYTLNGAGSGCSSKQSIVDEVNTYQGYLQAAFSEAQPD